MKFRTMERNLTQSETWATITPADLMRSVSRRLPSVFFTTLLVTVVIAGILFAWPNKYSSDGLFYVRLGRGAVSADPTAQPSGSVSWQESRASEVLSISEMITSREIADRVVKAIGAAEVNHPRTWIDRSMKSLTDLVPSASPGDMERGKYKRQLAHENAVEKIQDAISVNVPKDGYTLAVHSKTSDPILSQKIVQAIMDQYGSYHVDAHRSTGSLGFFEQQIVTSQMAAVESRKALQQARNEMGWMSTETAQDSLRQRTLNLELAMDQVESDLADSESLVKSLESQLTKVKDWIPVEISKVANNAADGMRTALYQYQMNEGEKLAKVTPSHPRYKLLQGKISQGQEIVSSEGTERAQTREAVNPVKLQLETAYQTAVAKTAGLRSRRKALSSSLDQANDDLRRLNDDMVKLAELNWDAEIAEKHYLSHAESLESARLLNELDNQKMSDISVIQNASLNLKKVGPPRLILTFIGGLLGICWGVLQALVRDNPVAARSRDHSKAREQHKDEKAGEELKDFVAGENAERELGVSLPR